MSKATSKLLGVNERISLSLFLSLSLSVSPTLGVAY